MYRHLTFEERQEIERMYNNDTAVSEIAQHLGRSLDVVYREISRGRTDDRTILKRKKYSAELGQQVYQDNIANRGRRKAPNS